MKIQKCVSLLLLFSLISNSSYSGDELTDVARLDREVREIPTVGFHYNGEDRLTREQAETLFHNSEAERHQQEIAASDAPVRCAADGSGSGTSTTTVTNSGRTTTTVTVTPPEEKKGWEVVFVARLAARSVMTAEATTVTNHSAGTAAFTSDLTEIQRLSAAGTLNETNLDEIFRKAGDRLQNNPLAAMAYVAEMGRVLDANYGDSREGYFVNRVEQYGRLAAGGSVGQCSDIHFAMLKAYKQLMGPNSKAYLVNFQTGGDLHHTEMIVEHQGQIYVIDYNKITTSPNGQLDVLAQTDRGGHGFGYRIFTDEGAELDRDRMVAHIDSPLGKFLREVSTGRASFNPFETTDYGMAQLGLHHSNGTDVKTFFGELGDGSVIMGIAVNLERVTSLPAGFNLETHFSAALSYAHRTFMSDNRKASMHSEILYINTGLGLVSPLLHAGPLSFQARTDLSLEGGGWIKQFTDFDGNPGDDNFEGDGNIISRTQARLVFAPTQALRVTATGTVELTPSFSTAFPSSTDGSSGAAGLPETIHVVPTRIQGDLDINYRLPSGVDLFAGITYQHTPLGGIGEARIGAGTDSLRASAFIRGALDRDQTPIFMPGARREVGASLFYCLPNDPNSPAWCVGASGRKAIEDNSWAGSLSAEMRW